MLSNKQRDSAHNRVIDLVTGKRYEDAIEYCNNNISNWELEDRHHAWGDLAYALAQSGRTSEALNAASHAIESAPEDRRHRFRRAMLATESGAYELASEDWSALIELEHKMNSDAFLATALLGRAFVRIHTHDFASALHDLNLVSEDEALFICGELRTAAGLRKRLSVGGGTEE